jgi:hypothetical protein
VWPVSYAIAPADYGDLLAIQATSMIHKQDALYASVLGFSVGYRSTAASTSVLTTSDEGYGASTRCSHWSTTARCDIVTSLTRRELQEAFRRSSHYSADTCCRLAHL